MLQAEKDPLNARNAYNHNYKDRWCYCDGPEELPMIQCIGCQDWYHGRCIHDSFDFNTEEFDMENYLCSQCLIQRKETLI